METTDEYTARQALTLALLPSFPPPFSSPPPSLPRVLVEDLMYRLGMVAATDVVVSGCSAGAVQTFINTGTYMQNRENKAVLSIPPSLSLSSFFLSSFFSRFLHYQTDKIRSLLPARMRVSGLPDSGFLVAYEGDGKE